MSTEDQPLEADTPVTSSEADAAAEAREAGTEHFDPAAAMAELEAAMAAADAAQDQGSDGSDNYIAMLEDEVLQLEALVASRDAALTAARERADEALRAANTRADGAHEQVAAARTRLERESEIKLRRRTRKVLLAFVKVFDDLKRALESARATDHNPDVVAGVELVQRSFLVTLEGFGVRQQAALGVPFDPAIHDAVSTLPVEDEAQDGKVIAVTTEGYELIGGELLRPAAVVVGKRS